MREYNYRFYAYLGAVFTLALILVFGLFSAYQPGRMWANARTLEAEAIERGAEVFAHDCGTCHGSRGEGVPNSGPALNTREFLKEASNEVIFNTITDGRPGTSMPAWGQSRGGPYNAQVVKDLVAFIRSWEPTAPSVEEIALQGDPVAGAVLFSTTCYACHGVSGEGRAGPPLNDPALLEKYDDNYFREAIADGRPERGMPTWGSVLSPAKIEDLVAYIRSWEREAPVAMASLGGDPIRGQDIFNSTCVVCHNPAGSATSIAPPLVEGSLLDDTEVLYSTINEGRLDKGMPSWGQVLSPAEINDVIAYLSTPETGESDTTAAPTKEEDDSLAQAEFLYIQQCAPCHGMSGEGRDNIPSLLNNEFVQNNDEETLQSFIATGRPNTAMAGFSGRLSEEEMSLIVQLLKRWP